MSMLQVRHEGRFVIVKFNQDRLTDREAVDVGKALKDASSNTKAGCLVLDFEHVEYISSSMIGQLFALRNECSAKDVDVKLCGLSPMVAEVFRIVQLSAMLDVFADVDKAKMAYDEEFLEIEDAEDEANLVQIRADAEAGDPDAQFQFAAHLDKGRDIEHNPQLAFDWYCKAAESGHAKAQHTLGHSYAFGVHVSQDYDEAIKWYRKAADQGDAESQYAMGMSHHFGIGASEDAKAAKDWYEKAAAQGHGPAEHALNELE